MKLVGYKMELGHGNTPYNETLNSFLFIT